MRFYSKDQGLSAFLRELAGLRAAARPHPPSNPGRGAGSGTGTPPHPVQNAPETNFAPQHENFFLHEGKCSDHPDAPHGFDRNSSHTLGRYVCECEGWSPDK